MFRVQARALARLSAASAVDVMYPMVAGVAQFRKLKAAFHEAVSGMTVGHVRHGVMLEVPAACLDAVTLLGEADFGSVGTNDLTQYLLAVDRDNELVADEFSYDTPALWRLLSEVASAGRETGKDVSVCGEMAGDPTHVGRLMEAGIRSVSVSARRIAVVRAAAAVLMQLDGK
jgi:phosphotransferase system enzyme I (PtsI)